MESKHSYIKGRCMDMCPVSELNMREKERLLHILEVIPGTEKNPKPKPDPNKVVKIFSRSVVGKTMQNANNLRPPEVLLNTVNYLLGEVISNSRVPWNVTYDFIMDRLRAVRQDMIIQNVSMAHSICILQPVVRFYAYASYRLCEESLGNFDPHINKNHLQECLKRLLCLYDECDRLYFKKDDSTENSYFVQEMVKIRPQFEALYLVLNLGSTTALTRALNLSKKWRKGVVNIAMLLSLSYYKNNFVRVCRLMKELPVLLLAVAVLHLPELRRISLGMMSTAYNSTNVTFPFDVLKGLFLFESVEETISECKHYGLQIKEKGVQFTKISFDNTKVPMNPRHLQLIDKKLEDVSIRELILI